MADEESQEISSGDSTEQTHESPKETKVAAPKVAATEPTRENFDLVKNNAEGIIARLDNMHKFMLDLGNYYFAFQGVCLAAISNTSFFVCNNAWFLTLLSILSAVPSLATLGFLAHEWIGLMAQLENK